MSDPYTTNPFSHSSSPVEAPNESDVSGVRDMNTKALTIIRHMDPDLHYVGESLPAPTDAETSAITDTNAAGNSIFPARADHKHAIKVRRSVGNLPGGSTIITPTGNVQYLNSWQTLAGSEDWLDPNNQVWVMPSGGFYLCNGQLQVERTDFSTGPTNIFGLLAYFGGAIGTFYFRLFDSKASGSYHTVSFTFSFSQYFGPGDYVQFGLYQTDAGYSWRIGSANISFNYLGQ